MPAGINGLIIVRDVSLGLIGAVAMAMALLLSSRDLQIKILLTKKTPKQLGHRESG